MGTIRRLWRQLLQHAPIVLGLVIGAGLLLYKLGSIPLAGVLSRPEAATAIISGSAHRLFDTAIYLPLTLPQYVAVRFAPLHDITSLRLASVVYALIILGSLFYVIRRWYGQRILLFAIAILITSAGLMHVGRLASVDILYAAAISLLLSSHLALHQVPGRIRSFIFWLAVVIFLCYIPGMIWLVILQAVWQRTAVKEGFVALGSWWRQLLVAGAASIGLAPLLYGFIKNLNYDYLLTWLGLPTALPSIVEVGKNAAAAVLFIGVKTPSDPARWLGDLPLLGAFMLVCFVAGVIFYVSHLKAERTQLLLSLSAISFILLAVGGPVSRSLLVPLVYLIAFGGLAYVLHYWLKLFPVNPIARRLGIGLITVAVGLACVYNLRHYFVAWPHNPDTRAAFSLRIRDR